MRTRLIVGSVAIAATAIGLTGCGAFNESHNYNAPAPVGNVQLSWERIESPGNYHTIIHSCFGKDGIYLTQADNNSATVVPNDPQCTGK